MLYNVMDEHRLRDESSGPPTVSCLNISPILF